MKTTFSTLFAAFFTAFTSMAQNNTLIVYSQDNLKFSVTLNGVQQGEAPGTNFKIKGLNAATYDVKVVFNSKITDVKQTVYLTNGAETTENMEYSYAVVKSKDKYKLKLKSVAPAPESAVTVPQQSVVMYNPTPAAVSVPASGNGAGTKKGNNNANVDMSINGINLSMNVNDMGNPTGVNGINGGATTTTTTTTTTTSFGTNTTTTMAGGGAQNTGYVLPGYTGVYGCPFPMSQNDFESAKASIKAKSFDDSKLTLAKQIVGSNCMLCSQIKELMLLFSFESNRLDLAKYAWHHNLDKGNYYKINDAFTFESSIDELNQYTQSH